MGFTKLDSGIIHSSIWDEELSTRILWITILALSDENGYVCCTPNALKRAANIPESDFDTSLKILESPDNLSKTPDNEGRRIIKTNGGWIITNFMKYRARSEIIKEQTRERVRKFREKNKQCNGGNVTYTLPSASASASASINTNTSKVVCGRRNGTEKHLDYVYLSNKEYLRLKSEYGLKFTEACVFKLNSYLTNNEKKRRQYKNHNLVIRDWVIDSVKNSGLIPIPEKTHHKTPDVEI